MGGGNEEPNQGVRERKKVGIHCPSSGLEVREYGHKDPHKLALTSPTSGGRSVGIVRSRTRATEFSFLHCPSRFTSST
jgi:hypothetical protein